MTQNEMEKQKYDKFMAFMKGMSEMAIGVERTDVNNILCLVQYYYTSLYAEKVEDGGLGHE